MTTFWAVFLLLCAMTLYPLFRGFFGGMEGVAEAKLQKGWSELFTRKAVFILPALAALYLFYWVSKPSAGEKHLYDRCRLMLDEVECLRKYQPRAWAWGKGWEFITEDIFLTLSILTLLAFATWKWRKRDGGDSNKDATKDAKKSKDTDKIAAEEQKRAAYAFYSASMPSKLVHANVLKRTGILILPAFVFILSWYLFAKMEWVKGHPGIVAAVELTMDVPITGLILGIVLTIAAAAWLDPRALMGPFVIFFLAGLSVLAYYTEGFVACFFEIPGWGPTIRFSPAFLALCVAAVAYYLLGTERFGALWIFLIVTVVSVWPNFWPEHKAGMPLRPTVECPLLF